MSRCAGACRDREKDRPGPSGRTTTMTVQTATSLSLRRPGGTFRRGHVVLELSDWSALACANVATCCSREPRDERRKSPCVWLSRQPRALIQQLLTESLIIALVGGAAGSCLPGGLSESSRPGAIVAARHDSGVGHRCPSECPVLGSPSQEGQLPACVGLAPALQLRSRTCIGNQQETASDGEPDGCVAR